MGACSTRPSTQPSAGKLSEVGALSPKPLHDDYSEASQGGSRTATTQELKGNQPVDLSRQRVGPTLLTDPDTSKLSESFSRELSQVSKGAGIDRAQFIVENPAQILDVYTLEKDKVMGEGTYGSVCKGRHKQTGQIRAVKTIPKEHLRKLERFKQEISFMKMLDHPNIIKLFETFEDRQAIYLVMELCSGGELFERIIETGRFTEAQAASVMQQILRAVNYMHDQGVVHRDIKPENFLFLNKDDDIEKSILKIIDFGLSCKNSQTPMKTKAGTPYYVAPQVLAGSYDRSCDLWSCGVIMYTLLCGYPPFWGKTDAEVLVRVKRGNYAFEAKHWKHISEDAKALVRMMLTMNPRDRCTADQALNHTWIMDKAPRASTVSLDTTFVENLRGFRLQNRLKKAALNVIAGQLQEDKVQTLRDAFVAFDANGDGLLTLDELRAGLEKAGLDEQLPAGLLKQIVDDVDANGSGQIDYTEFLAAGIDSGTYLNEDVVYSAFRVFDADGDGQITKEELKLLLTQGEGVADAPGAQAMLADVLREVDADGDGSISFEEFTAMMRGGSSFAVAAAPSGDPPSPQARLAGA